MLQERTGDPVTAQVGCGAHALQLLVPGRQRREGYRPGERAAEVPDPHAHPTGLQPREVQGVTAFWRGCGLQLAQVLGEEGREPRVVPVGRGDGEVHLGESTTARAFPGCDAAGK
ncbi:hypothetical protein VN1338_38030 [Helicobacter pylori]